MIRTLARALRPLIAGIGLLTVSACTHAGAKTAPEMPGLEVPPPPPRVIEPTEAEAPEPVPLPKEPARHAPPPPARPSRPEQPRAEAPKQEPPKPETPAPEPPHEEPSRPAPPTTLQTTPTQAEGEVERGIRSVLSKALSDLNRVDYRVLNSDARMQYDQAKRFVQQADEALKSKNLVFARTVAEKAAAMAAQLAGR